MRLGLRCWQSDPCNRGCALGSPAYVPLKAEACCFCGHRRRLDAISAAGCTTSESLSKCKLRLCIATAAPITPHLHIQVFHTVQTHQASPVVLVESTTRGCEQKTKHLHVFIGDCPPSALLVSSRYQSDRPRSTQNAKKVQPIPISHGPAHKKKNIDPPMPYIRHIQKNTSKNQTLLHPFLPVAPSNTTGTTTSPFQLPLSSSLSFTPSPIIPPVVPALFLAVEDVLNRLTTL